MSSFPIPKETIISSIVVVVLLSIAILASSWTEGGSAQLSRYSPTAQIVGTQTP